MKGLIYFIQRGEDGPIKIGFTRRQVDARMQQIRPTSPDPLRVRFVIAGHPRDERFYHSVLSHVRIRGEWFEPGPAIDLLIEGLSRDARAMAETREIQAHLDRVEDNRYFDRFVERMLMDERPRPPAKPGAAERAERLVAEIEREFAAKRTP